MAEIVRMPKLSDTMTEGVVAEWHKKVGDDVESGELLAEIETDKATMEFESFQDGTLLYIGVEKGKAAPVDGILAILGNKGENIDALLKEEASAPADKPAESKPAPAKKETAPVKKAEVSSAPKPAPKSVASSNNQAIKASPLAKKLALEKGLNINKVSGSGPDGRIVKRDIENYEAPSAGGFVGEESYTDEPISQMRKTIARRLSESKFTAPHFYLTIDVDMDQAIEARKAINQSIAPSKVSFNDMVVKAVAMALQKHPKVNASWREDHIRYNKHVHIGVAVAVEDGLLVPVIRFADGQSFTQIGSQVKDLAEKAKSKKLQPQDWEGNTFTISNLGMFGIEEFTAIVNPPDACIMAIGGIRQEPVVKNNTIQIGNRMKVTLSCDHRVVDGASGAAFLQSFKQMLESPVSMLA